jgi:hypothetical protein
VSYELQLPHKPPLSFGIFFPVSSRLMAQGTSERRDFC